MEAVSATAQNQVGIAAVSPWFRKAGNDVYKNVLIHEVKVFPAVGLHLIQTDGTCFAISTYK